MQLSALDRAEAMRADFNEDWLHAGFVNMFMDGVVDSGTSYMLDDYPGQPGHRSEPLFPQAWFNEIACEIDRRELQIAVHAIGDGAVRTVIDGYEAARIANGARDSRHRIEHIELIDRADIPRLCALSLQPAHPPGSMDFPLFPTLDMIGQPRWRDRYLCRTLVAAGAPLAFASDWLVADISVLRGIKAAMTRNPYDEACASERLDLESVLTVYTRGGAWAAHQEDLVGRLAPGMAGDLVMLSADIEATAPIAIDTLDIALTVAGGRITHEAAA